MSEELDLRHSESQKEIEEFLAKGGKVNKMKYNPGYEKAFQRTYHSIANPGVEFDAGISFNYNLLAPNLFGDLKEQGLSILTGEYGNEN